MKLNEFFTYGQDGAKEDKTYNPDNDISVLENHHLATGFKLLRQDGCNIFENCLQDLMFSYFGASLKIVILKDL